MSGDKAGGVPEGPLKPLRAQPQPGAVASVPRLVSQDVPMGSASLPPGRGGGDADLQSLLGDVAGFQAGIVRGDPS